MTLDQFVVVMLAAAFITGLRSTIRLIGKYRHTSEVLAGQGEPNYIGAAFVIVSALVTLLVGTLGFISARRLLGYDPLPASALVTTIFAIPVLFIPVILDGTFDYIARQSEPDD